MKKYFIVIGAIILVILLILAVIIGRIYYARIYGDQYTETAKQLNPLGMWHTYIISPNEAMISGSDGSLIPAGSYYAFYPAEDAGKDAESKQKLWGRYVSDKTEIDLTPYLGKPVHIWGKFEHGDTKLIEEVTSSAGLIGTEVLIIEKVELAD